MMGDSPFGLCRGCEYEGVNHSNMPCKACTFGSRYKKKYEYRISYADFYNSLVCDRPYKSEVKFGPLEIKKVIFNDPATIVLWMDGTKTVVKAQHGEMFDPEKGLTMAICKKAYGNTGNYFNKIKEWTEQYESKDLYSHLSAIASKRMVISDELIKSAKETIDRFNSAVSKIKIGDE
jgi:hypothetical protein